VLLVLSGCGSDALDAASENSSRLGTSSSAASATPAANQADVHFAQQMVPHLDQAVQMSIMLLAKPGVDLG
jgi:uncharacterized protein (DUF305 family)